MKKKTINGFTRGAISRCENEIFIFLLESKKKKATRDKMFVMTNIRDKEGP